MQGQKAAEGDDLVRLAQKNERKMGFAVRKYVPDEITGEDRYEHQFGWGFDAKTPRLESSGSGYRMAFAPRKVIGTTVLSAVGMGLGGFTAWHGYRSGSTGAMVAGGLIAAVGGALMVPYSWDR